MLGNAAVSSGTVKTDPRKHTVPMVIAWLGSGSARTGRVSWTAGDVMASITVVMPRTRRTVVSLASPLTFQEQRVVARRLLPAGNI